MEQPPAIPPVTPTNQPAKKGLPAIAWIGIGCGGLLLLGIVAIVGLGMWGMGKAKELNADFRKNPEKATAEIIISMNQEYEKVSSDDTAGTMTIRDKSGKESTISYRDIKEGKFLITDADGNSTVVGGAVGDLSKLPAWIPIPPNVKNARNAVHTGDASGAQGMFVYSSGMNNEELVVFYEDNLKSSGFTQSTVKTTKVDNFSTTNLVYKSGGDQLTLSISNTGEGDTHVNGTYVDKK